MDIQKAQFLNGNTPIGLGYMYIRSGGLGMKTGWVKKVYVFEKWTSAPHERRYLFKLLRWPIAPEGSSWHNNEKKKKKTKRLSPPQGTSRRSEKAVVGENTRGYICRRNMVSLAFVVEEMGI